MRHQTVHASLLAVFYIDSNATFIFLIISKNVSHSHFTKLRADEAGSRILGGVYVRGYVRCEWLMCIELAIMQIIFP